MNPETCAHVRRRLSLQTGHMECLDCGKEFELVGPDQWVEVPTYG